MSEHRWWHERGQQLRADRIHLSRVRPLTGERQRPGLGKRSENAARRRRARGFAELVDAFCLLVRRACLGPIEQRPTTWLGEPPSLVVARAFDADEFETTTKAEAARSPDVVLEPTRADSHSRCGLAAARPVSRDEHRRPPPRRGRAPRPLPLGRAGQRHHMCRRRCRALATPTNTGSRNRFDTAGGAGDAILEDRGVSIRSGDVDRCRSRRPHVLVARSTAQRRRDRCGGGAPGGP